MTETLLTVFKATMTQLTGILGLFFVLGFLLSILEQWTQKCYQRALGWKGILWTAWIGTPVHELAHVCFAFLFHHKIHTISLFQPDPSTGRLGHVDYSYKRFSPWQGIGTFFVGSAPLIIGSAVLTALLYILIPNSKEIFVPLTNNTTIQSFLTPLFATVQGLITSINIHDWHFWLFIYLSFCIVSHIAPSRQDRRSMWHGLPWMIGIIFLINIIALWAHIDLTANIHLLTQYFGIMTALFLYALIISAIHCLLTNVVVRVLVRS